MDDVTRIMLRSLIRYSVIPCGLGLAAMAAIVLPGHGDELTMTRLLAGCSMLVLFPAVMAWPLWQLDKRRMEREAAARDAAHRAATVAAFEADVERITGRPFPTGQ